MRGRIVAVLALSLAVIAPAAFAQQSGTQSAAAPMAAATSKAGEIEVTGTIVKLSLDRIEVKVDSVNSPSGVAAGSNVAVGTTAAFKLDPSTAMPKGLSADNRVDLWCRSDNGSLLATRVALAVSADQPGEANEAAAMPQASGGSATSATEASGVTGAKAQGEPASTAPAASNAHQGRLPKTGSPLPLIGLLGVAALVSAFVLRFVMRA